MKKLFVCADQFIKESDWKELALVKFCLCAMGIMIGLCISKEKKKYSFFMAFTVFLVTYIPLMIKFGKTAVKVFAPEKNQGRSTAAMNHLCLVL